jgi:hypothetical protein
MAITGMPSKERREMVWQCDSAEPAPLILVRSKGGRVTALLGTSSNGHEPN